jgi:hypothetical protein
MWMNFNEFIYIHECEKEGWSWDAEKSERERKKEGERERTKKLFIDISSLINHFSYISFQFHF